MPAADTTPVLRDRWSPRVYDPDHELSDAELRSLLEAARWAPSAGNSQPWAFLVGRRGDPTHREIVHHLSRGNTPWVPRASAVLISALQHASGPEPDALDYSDYAQYDLGQAVAHLTVQAASLGLHVHQFAGFDHDGLAAAFGVPPHWRVTTGIAVGRHGDPGATDVPEREQPERKPLAELVYAGQWGTPAVWL